MQTSVSPHVYTSPQFLFQLAREGKHFQTMTPTRIYNESHCKTWESDVLPGATLNTVIAILHTPPQIQENNNSIVTSPERCT